MSNIQKTLDSLQPYVIGIRYLEGMAVVDAVFKDGWTVPDSDTVKKIKGDEGLNYYMILSEKDGIGLDDLLEYVGKTIKINLEREKKHELLKDKANELKELFKKTSFEKLKRLKFVIGDEELVPELNEFEIDLEEPKENVINNTTHNIVQDPIEEEIVDEAQTLVSTPNKLLDENGKEIPLTEDELEMIEEEARAKRNLKIIEATKNKSEINKINNKTIELPPKKVVQNRTQPSLSGCNCGPEEACEKCIDTKY